MMGVESSPLLRIPFAGLYASLDFGNNWLFNFGPSSFLSSAEIHHDRFVFNWILGEISLPTKDIDYLTIKSTPINNKISNTFFIVHHADVKFLGQRVPFIRISLIGPKGAELAKIIKDLGLTIKNESDLKREDLPDGYQYPERGLIMLISIFISFVLSPLISFLIILPLGHLLSIFWFLVITFIVITPLLSFILYKITFFLIKNKSKPFLPF